MFVAYMVEFMSTSYISPQAWFNTDRSLIAVDSSTSVTRRITARAAGTNGMTTKDRQAVGYMPSRTVFPV